MSGRPGSSIIRVIWIGAKPSRTTLDPYHRGPQRPDRGYRDDHRSPPGRSDTAADCLRCYPPAAQELSREQFVEELRRQVAEARERLQLTTEQEERIRPIFEAQ